MKNIGQTVEGNTLVELTKQETYAFEMLCRAIEGRPWPEPFESNRASFEHDLSHTFDVIRSWTSSRMRISEMEIHIQRLKADLEKL